ncbi:MAG: hypothetical protein COW67_06635 [Flavobacteriales bacterium CG18_big_fil_WC_8_21_14_2_50_32_9]|nr:MAG: hypothetical protein COW67_06635 [Flavobacteriales bacterium CG18_big_fil_WC_8_21_14_2_50_32_9]
MFEEEEEEENEEFDNYKKLPVYKKANEIIELIDKISHFINESIDKNLEDTELLMAKTYVDDIVGNAYIIAAKIAGAEAVDLYDIKMENAAIIRKAAREIKVNCTGLTMFDIDGFDYLDLLREEMELFRVEFAEWVKTFDPWNYIIDRWGLFNPPGVNYDDHDPDDDIPFNPEDFFK